MRKNSRRLNVESLESRRMLAADISLTNAGQLVLKGTSGDDTAVVSTDNGQIVAQLNNLNQSFDASQVQQIIFRGKRGDDSFTNNTNVSANAAGHKGNDTLIGGTANDNLRGGRGNDNLQGGSGNDGLRGGKGNDNLNGGDGADTIQGDRGQDNLNGGDGDDNLNAGKGRDNVADTSGVNVVNTGRGVDNAAADFSLGDVSDLQITVEVRFLSLRDDFLERMGIDFDIDLSGAQTGDRTQLGTIQIDPPKKNFRGDVEVEVTQGANSLGTLKFDGPVNETAMNVGFAILSDIEAFFFIEAVQSDRRGNILQAPSVTLFNGQSATVNDATVRPFVTSIIPVVG